MSLKPLGPFAFQMLVCLGSEGSGRSRVVVQALPGLPALTLFSQPDVAGGLDQMN